MLSILIPTFKEPFLNQTMRSLIDNARGEIEVLPIFDGVLPEEEMLPDKCIRPIFLKEHKGLRAAVNAGLEHSVGDWVMKCDAHCAFAPGYDTQMIEDARVDWLMVPRRYSLEIDAWGIAKHRPHVDYQYLSFPGTQDPKYGYAMQVINWGHKSDQLVDDTMVLQGSCWLAHKAYFMARVGFLDDKNYDKFVHEQVEICLKYWLSEGAVKVDKNTWYAHLSKRQAHYDAGMFSVKHKKDGNAKLAAEWSTRHWINNEEPLMTRPFSWLIEHFQPPGWESNWQEVWNEHEKFNNIPS